MTYTTLIANGLHITTFQVQSAFCLQTVFMCLVRCSEITVNISPEKSPTV